MALDEGHRVAARGGVQGHTGARDAAADDDHVEVVLLDCRERLVAGDHLGESPRPGRRARAPGGFCSWTGVPGEAGRRTARPRGMPTAARPSGVRSTLGRPPVGRQPSTVGGEQDDVGGAGGGVQVLLVLDRVAGERAGADHQGRRAIELRGRLRAGGLLEPLERLRADHPEAPGVGQVVVRGPAGQVEQLLERPRGPRARAGRPCGCGACGSPPRLPWGNVVERRCWLRAGGAGSRAQPPQVAPATSATTEEADQRGPGRPASRPPGAAGRGARPARRVGSAAPEGAAWRRRRRARRSPGLGARSAGRRIAGATALPALDRAAKPPRRRRPSAPARAGRPCR